MSLSPKVRLLHIFCCTLLLAGIMPVFAQTSPEEDGFLQLLRQELQLQYDSLQRADYPPYYLAYRVNETAEHRITASFGKIYNNSTSKTVSLTIEMRVGTPETDNYHYLTRKTPYIKHVSLPIDGNLLLIRKILKNETREAYQKAVVQSVGNKVAAAFLEGEDDIEKFSYIHHDMDGYYEPPMMESYWNDDIWEHSMGFCTLCHQLDLTESSADFVYQTTRKYLVNSENSYFAQNNSSAMVTLRVGGLTPENTVKHIERHYFGVTPNQLPDEDVLASEMDEMRVLLSNVLHAEKCNISRCPVLLSPKAASVLIHNLLGHELENHDNSLFRDKSGHQVMPESFSLYSDPSLNVKGNNPFAGSYMFDDEGIMGRKTIHIDHGELKQLLATRTQQPSAYQANGHARGNRLLPSARQSNLFFESSKTLNNHQLFDLLMSEAASQRLEYGIYVEEAEVLCDTNNVITICPTICYKRSTNPREPEVNLRDIVLTGSKQQWINNLTATGDVTSSVTIICHSQGDDLPTSCTSPALLFRSAEIKQQTSTPRPKLVQRFDGEGTVTPMSMSELLQKSGQYEWDMDVSLLKTGDETPPYYEDFLMTDAQISTVEASGGSVFYANEKSVRQFVPRVLLGDNRFNSDHLTEVTAPPASYPLPFGNRYTFARDFRQAANAEYLKVLQQWKTKQALLPPESRTRPDRSYAPATQTDGERTFEHPTLNNLEHFACETSAALAKHSFLNRSGVNIYIMQGNAYFWSSEKTTYSRPVSVIALQIYGTVELRESKEYVDAKTLFFPCTDSLLSLQRIQNEINAFAQHLQNMKGKRDYFQYYHNGPVLIEGEAVGQILASSLLETTPNLLAHRDPVLTTLPSTKSFENQLDNIITAKKISVTANKSGDKFSHSTFVRSEKTDAEGVETQETEIIRNGELITLMGNRNITESTSYSNGFQQLAIHNEGCFGTRGASRLDFEHKSTVSHKKLKQMLIREAKRQGCRYAYIIRQFYDANMQNIMDKESPHYVQLLQCYRVDVRTGEEIPMVGAKMLNPNFHLLQNILYVSDNQTAFPVMMQIRGASGTRDFPFTGVPTCIVAPDGILLKRMFIED